MQLKSILFAMTFLIGAELLARPSQSEALLAQDLSSSIRTLNRQVLLYHYGFANDVASLNSPRRRAAWAMDHLESVLNPFWSTNTFGGSSLAAGVGFYLATDPASSKGYGSMLMEMSFPAGTRFFDLSKKIPLRAQTVQALVAEGYFNEADCVNLFLSNSARCDDAPVLKAYALTKISFSENKNRYTSFRKLLLRVIANMQVDLIEYKWSSSYTEQFCKNASDSAFILISRSGLERFATNVVYFQNGRAFPLAGMTAAEIATAQRTEKFRNVMVSIKNEKDAGKRAQIISSQYPPQELQLLKSTIYKCQ